MRGSKRLLPLLFLSAWSCTGADAVPAPGRGQLTLVGFSSSEVFETPTQQFRLEVMVSNVGGKVISNFATEEGRVFLDGVPQVVRFVLVPDDSAVAIGMGQQGTLVFVAELPSIHFCAPLICEPNPHHGLLTGSVRITSNVGSWFVQGDVALSCFGAYPRACTASVQSACALTTDDGDPLFRCLPTWQDVLADRPCGLVESDRIADCGPRYRWRQAFNRVGAVNYFYDLETDSLVALQSALQCVGGPCAGFVHPPCDDLQVFYDCPTDGGMP